MRSSRKSKREPFLPSNVTWGLLLGFFVGFCSGVLLLRSSRKSKKETFLLLKVTWGLLLWVVWLGVMVEFLFAEVL